MKINSNNKKNKKELKGASKINLLDKRIICLSGEIDRYNASSIIEELLKLDEMESKKDITMYINSGGGSVSAGMAIIDAMNMVKCDVSTVCIGVCASMAAVILSAGAKGKRKILPNAEVMIHEVSTMAYGKMEEVKNDLEHSTKVNQRVLKMLSTNTGQSIKRISKDTLKDMWFTSTEALKYGLVDEVVTR